MISYVCALFVKGLAYVDFSDDAHLEAAVAKNKKELLGKKLFIARSDPSGRNRGKQKTSMENGMHCTPSTFVLFLYVFLSLTYIYIYISVLSMGQFLVHHYHSLGFCVLSAV